MENFINAIAGLTKHGIDMNPNFSEWEKWWRKSPVDNRIMFAAVIYEPNLKACLPQLLHQIHPGI